MDKYRRLGQLNKDELEELKERLLTMADDYEELIKAYDGDLIDEEQLSASFRIRKTQKVTYKDLELFYSGTEFVEDDFVFSAIVEEMGFVTGIALLGICLISFIRALIMAARLRSMFYRLLAVGLASAYIFQVFLTVGGGVKFIPLTGVTLPFVSYGLSSLLSNFLLIGLVLNIGLQRNRR